MIDGPLNYTCAQMFIKKKNLSNLSPVVFRVGSVLAQYSDRITQGTLSNLATKCRLALVRKSKVQ